MAEKTGICPRCTKVWEGEHKTCPDDGQKLLVVSSSSDERVGEVIDGRFTLLGVLGIGGIGAVYRALQHSMQREVALKILRKSFAEDPAMVQRFLREAKCASHLHHPNVITLFDFGQTEQGELFLTMELLKGKTLRELMDERRRLPLGMVISVGTQVCDALQAAHNAGVTHRDLKPDNIFVLGGAGVSGPFVKVIDFGIAKLQVVEGGDSITQQGMVCGTPIYMSPEQAMGQGLDHRADLYSLAVVLYECLAGYTPFKGDTALQTIMAHIHEDPPKLRERRPELPLSVEQALEKALEKVPDDRPQTASDLRESLLEAVEDISLEGAFARGRSLAPSRPDQKETAETVIETADTVIDTPAPAKTLFEAKRPKKAHQALLSALFFMVVLFGSALLWIQGRELFLGAPSMDDDVAQDEADPPPPFPPRMPSSRDVLRVGAHTMTTLRGSHMARGVFWGTTKTLADGTVVPVLVRRLPSLTNGDVVPRQGGGLIVTWHLRQSLRWSDGQPLSAQDLVYALEVFPQDHVIKAHATDERTFVVHWDDEVSAAYDSLNPLPRHALDEVFQASGSKGVLEHLRSHPVPSVGPYYVASYEMNKSLVALANPHFVGPPPSIARVEYVCGSTDRIVAAFEAGDIDLILPNMVSLAQAEQVRARQPEAVHIRPSSGQVFLHPDLSHPLLKELSFRKAILQAIDREKLAHEVYGPAGRVSHAPTLEDPGAGVVRHSHDPDQARAVFEKTSPTKLTLTYTKTETTDKIVGCIGKNLGVVGLQLDLRTVGSKERSHLYRERNHGGLLLYVLRISPMDNVLAHWNLPLLKGQYVRTARHPAYDDWVATLVERQDRTAHIERRAQLRDDLAGEYSKRLPHIPLVFTAERVLAHPDLRGWDGRLGDRFGEGIETWYFVH